METRMEEGAGDTVTELINGVDFENPKHQSVISNGYGPYAGTLTHGYTCINKKNGYTRGALQNGHVLVIKVCPRFF
jgi:hypothetical protein